MTSGSCRRRRLPSLELKHCRHCHRDLPKTNECFERKRKVDGTQYVASQARCKELTCSRQHAADVRTLRAAVAHTYPADNRCQSCGELRGGRLRLDHCHVTGLHRGWPCHACNCGSGMFGDEYTKLRRMLLYYERFYARVLGMTCVVVSAWALNICCIHCIHI